MSNKTSEIEKGAKVGKANGLTLLLDAETFDYMYTVGNSPKNNMISKIAKSSITLLNSIKGGYG